MKKYAIIVAGGSGKRMGSAVPKQFLPVHGRPVLWHTLRAFLQAYSDLVIILVLPAEHLETGREIAGSTGEADRIWLTTGGETRFHSVKNGLDRIRETSMVFVHDGVRCLISKELIYRCFDKAVETGNAIPAITCTDSIRIETPEGNEPLDRDLVRIIQTPQTFTSKIIIDAFGQGYDPSFTDEASVVERLGIRINLVEGEAANIKITRPIDLVIAEKIFEERLPGGGV